MATNADTENESTDTKNDAENFDPQNIRRYLPSGITDAMQRILVCAIRNPDSSPTQIAKKVGAKSSYQATNALRSLLTGVAGNQSNTPDDLVELRGSATKQAESYSELTDKQRTIIDFAAKHPEYVEENTNEQVQQAIFEQEDIAVSAPYVGSVQEQYRGILEQRRAIEAASGNSEQDLEDVTGKMTVREMLEASGYPLPEENLDEMPPAGECSLNGGGGGEAQTTLSEAEDEASEFQPASEADGTEVGSVQAADGGTADVSWRFSDGWPDVPGADEAQRLPDDAEYEDVNKGQAYIGYINGIRSYGVFISLTNPVYGDDVSGLIPEERLHGTVDDYERGDYLVVYLYARKHNGLQFIDWRLENPDQQEQEADEGDEGEQEQEAEEPDEADEDSDTRQDQAVEGEVLDRLDTLDDEVLDRLDTLDERVDSMEDAVDTLRGDTVMASEMKRFAGSVEDNLLALRENVEELIDDADGIEEAQDRQDDRLDELAERVDGIDAKQEVRGEELDALHEHLEKVSKMVDKLSELVDQADDAAADAIQRAAQADDAATGVAERLDEMEEQATTAALDAVEERLENSVRADLVERVEQMEQQHDTLQEMVNALGEQQHDLAQPDGLLGRMQQDIQRLDAQGVEVKTYRYTEENGRIHMKLTAGDRDTQMAEDTEAHQAEGQEGEDD